MANEPSIKLIENVKLALGITYNTIDDRIIVLSSSAINDLRRLGIPELSDDHEDFPIYCELIQYEISPKLNDNFNVSVNYLANLKEKKDRLRIKYDNLIPGE